MPFVPSLLNRCVSYAGAMQAVAMVAQILQRHVNAMQNSSTCLAIDAAANNAAEQPVPHQQADNETMRQDIMRALFAEPAERCVSPPLPPPATTPATPLPVLPTSLVRPSAHARPPEVRTGCFHSRRRLRPRRLQASCASQTGAAACRLRMRSSSRRCSRRRSVESTALKPYELRL